MKTTWMRIAGATLTFALSTACTVTVGDGIDDSDDLDFTDKTDAPETTDRDRTSSSDSSSSSTSSSSDDSSSTSPNQSSTSSETSSSEPVDTSSGTTEEPVGICDPEPEEGTCEECVNYSCRAEWQACCAADGCVETWLAIYSCVVEFPSDDPWNDFDQCAAGASETGDQLDLPDEVLDLTSCVNERFKGDPDTDELGRQEGDGTCTLACYNVPSLDL